MSDKRDMGDKGHTYQNILLVLPAAPTGPVDEHNDPWTAGAEDVENEDGQAVVGGELPFEPVQVLFEGVDGILTDPDPANEITTDSESNDPGTTDVENEGGPAVVGGGPPTEWEQVILEEGDGVVAASDDANKITTDPAESDITTDTYEEVPTYRLSR